MRNIHFVNLWHIYDTWTDNKMFNLFKYLFNFCFAFAFDFVYFFHLNFRLFACIWLNQIGISNVFHFYRFYFCWRLNNTLYSFARNFFWDKTRNNTKIICNWRVQRIILGKKCTQTFCFVVAYDNLCVCVIVTVCKQNARTNRTQMPSA